MTMPYLWRILQVGKYRTIVGGHVLVSFTSLDESYSDVIVGLIYSNKDIIFVIMCFQIDVGIVKIDLP